MKLTKHQKWIIAGGSIGAVIALWTITGSQPEGNIQRIFVEFLMWMYEPVLMASSDFSESVLHAYCKLRTGRICPGLPLDTVGIMAFMEYCLIFLFQFVASIIVSLALSMLHSFYLKSKIN